MSKISELRFESFEHLPYLLDLGPSDYHLSNFKTSLIDEDLKATRRIIDAISNCFEELEK